MDLQINEERIQINLLDTLFFFRSCITRGISRLAKPEKPQHTERM